MFRIFIAALFLFGLAACKDKKPNLAGDEKVTADEFLNAFQQVKLPLSVSDTALKSFHDSTIISKTVFAQFIADSALSQFTKDSDSAFVINPAGAIKKEDGDFLMATFTSKKQVQLGVFVLDKEHKFQSSFYLLGSTQNDKYDHSLSITEDPAFIIKKEKIIDNKSYYSRNGYAYDKAKKEFSEVLHDSNEDTSANNEIINPIDTFPITNKFSGDYSIDKRNFISVRDGKNAVTYSFFIHFEKEKGSCVGELKGMMSLTDENNAIYTEGGDPCVINFKFTGSSVKVKEEGNCGNHRGITCPYDFTFKKKKTSKTKTTSK